MEHFIPVHSELGKTTVYENHYNPEKLFPIPRKIRRDEIGITGALPFYGFDVWNHYEVSWLNEKGKPVVAIAEVIYGCDSENIIESKSMKLYFNTFNNSHFKNADAVAATIKEDLQARLQGSYLEVRVIPLRDYQEDTFDRGLTGINLDELDIECHEYHTNPNYLTTDDEWVEETLCTDLLKSNCLVTNQPDWCSVEITYQGPRINHEGLLRYIVSFRDDNEFHEQCIEKIFIQIMQYCKPSELTVFGRSTRRGGLDINSYRSTQPIDPKAIHNKRLCRQ